MPLRVPLDGRVTGMPWDEIDTVVFDVGNVLLSFNPEKTLEELFPEDAEKRQIMLDTVFRSPCWVMLDRGTLPRKEARRDKRNWYECQLGGLILSQPSADSSLCGGSLSPHSLQSLP